MADDDRLPLDLQDPPEPQEPPVGDQEPPSPEPEPQDDSQARLEELAKENQSLREQLSDIVKTFGKKEPSPPIDTTPARREPPPRKEVNFLEGVDIDSLYDNPGPVLNNLLNKVFNLGRESVMEDLPELVHSHAAQTVEVRMKAKEFWETNKDLKDYGDFVGLVANQVANENPTWDIDQVYQETGKRVRTRLQPILQSKKTDDGLLPDPALPAPKGGRRPPQTPQKVEGEAKEMDDLLKFAGG